MEINKLICDKCGKDVVKEDAGTLAITVYASKEQRDWNTRDPIKKIELDFCATCSYHMAVDLGLNKIAEKALEFIAERQHIKIKEDKK